MGKVAGSASAELQVNGFFFAVNSVNLNYCFFLFFLKCLCETVVKRV